MNLGLKVQGIFQVGHGWMAGWILEFRDSPALNCVSQSSRIFSKLDFASDPVRVDIAPLA
eukprot:CAMPEP_0206493894 /NCGR_PEP_ID=MMETSP0324_2-20121206/47331_1 /ASSEMBLY_ACC=CAM_ASM_000836 /TAXON_ID=2866 /ORGANISM="Crypthecodinium cohnii, Strain Seligo" /LENGTH=59 /DNA_ID=CAMNT_0053977299 /DNA_START=28 /DNA_END=207 /DNA_ORIENTATION=+